MSAPNLLTNTTLTGKGAVGVVTTSLANAIANAAASGTFVRVDTFTVSNVHASSSTAVDVSVYNGTNDRYLVKNINLLPGETMSMPVPIHLEEGFSIRVVAVANSVLEWVGSYSIWS